MVTKGLLIEPITDHIVVKGTNHIFTNIKPYMVYLFSVKASNRCGSSPASSATTQDTRTPPLKITELRSFANANKCAAQVAWTPPLNGGAPISRYSIEVKNKENTYSKFEACSLNPNIFECSIDYGELRKQPFNLNLGE